MFRTSLRRLIAGIVLIAIIGGCASTPEFREPEIAPLDPARRAAESTCPASDANRCALASPFNERTRTLFETGRQLVTLLEVGEDALAARVHLIRSARSSIDIQTYVWAADESGFLLINELLAAARRGVKVRVIADQLYTQGDPQSFAQLALAHRNLDIRLYNPLGQEAVSTLADKARAVFGNFSVINHRMHNKLMVFDNRIAITGGRNIENKYFDYDPGFNFIDRDVIVAGNVVEDMTAIFETYWQAPIVVDIARLTDVHAELERIGYTLPAGRLDIATPALFEPLIAAAIDPGYVTARFIEPGYEVTNVHYSADRPAKPFVRDGERGDASSAKLREVVSGMQSRLSVQTPYFILSDEATDALRAIRKEKPGVEYSVVTNSLASIDHYFVYALSYKRKKRNLEDLGFRIFELNPFPRDVRDFVPRYDRLGEVAQADAGFTPIDTDDDAPAPVFAPVPVDGTGARICLHAKSLVVDSSIGVVGSHNFDPRSSAINTESALIVWDERFAAALENNIARSGAPGNAWVAAPRQKVPLIGHLNGFFASISRALPLFDLWPFRATSNFALKDGAEPVPHTHPEFYERYTDVGQFPGTSLGDKQLRTYLVSGFGAVAEPLL